MDHQNHSSHLTTIRRLVARVRRRVRAQIALRRLLIFGALGLLAFGVVVLLVKARVAPLWLVDAGGGLAIGLPLLGALSALAGRLDEVQLAARLDSAGGLQSRLGSALAFARLPAPSEFHQAAIADAATVLDKAEPRRAAPWQWAAFTVAGVFALAAVALTGPAVFVAEFPVSPTAGLGLVGGFGPPPTYERDKADIQKHDKDALEDAQKTLQAQSLEAKDAAVKDFMAELNELLRALMDNRITPEEAFTRLAQLDKAADEWSDKHARDFDEVAQKLVEAARKKRRAHKDVDPMLQALRERRWKEAAKALDRLADKLADQKRRDRQRIARDLDDIAKKLQSERQRQRDRLKRQRDRLKQKEQKLGKTMTKRDRDRLKQTRRELERLRREQEQLSEMMRQLERLHDNLSQAAKDLLRRMSQQAGAQQQQDRMTAEQMRQAAEMMRRMGQSGLSRRQMRVAEARMVDLKEMLRRAGQQKKGQGGKGNDGKGEMKRFLVKAGGKGDGKPGGEQAQGQDGKAGKGQQVTMLKPGGEGKGGDMMLLGPKMGQGAARMPLPGQGGDQGQQPMPGDGAGTGHDPNMLGERTKLDFRAKEDFIAGQQGKGASRNRVIMTAASRGFSSRAYRDVHQDYSGVVEDALDKQKIPPGKRSYVRRYFDLIRPR